MQRNTTAAVGMVLVTLSFACTKPAAKSPDAPASGVTSKDSSSMADMPGMDTKGMAGMPADSKNGAPATDDSTNKSVIAKELTLNAAQIQHGNIKWSPAVMSTAALVALIPGVLVPNEDRTVRLGAPAPGRVVKVFVRPGDYVRADQPLVSMQSPAAGLAQSEVTKAVAGVSVARAESQYAVSARARAERLLALKAIPRQEYERAITDDEQARASLVQAEAEAHRARTTANQLSAGGGANGEIVVRAPIAGVVLSRTAVPGAVIEAGSPLVIITDLSTLWLTINAPEPMTSLFRRSATLRFTVPAYPGDTMVARTEAVGAGLDEATRTLTVRGLITNVGGRLKPEMLANVIVSGGAKTPAVLLPEDAVQSIEGKPHVFIARASATGDVLFVRREVAVGTRTDGKIAVLRGLSAGELVVTSGAFSVKAQFQKGAMAKMEM